MSTVRDLMLGAAAAGGLVVYVLEEVKRPRSLEVHVSFAGRLAPFTEVRGHVLRGEDGGYARVSHRPGNCLTSGESCRLRYVWGRGRYEGVPWRPLPHRLSMTLDGKPLGEVEVMAPSEAPVYVRCFVDVRCVLAHPPSVPAGDVPARGAAIG
jgi:hypothetical protein